jgi:hypothetical protein
VEVKATHLGNNDFRVEADGVSMDVSLAIYVKVGASPCMHLTVSIILSYSYSIQV